MAAGAPPPPPQEAPTILLADDHAPLRASVRRDVELAGLRVCAEAATAAEAIDAAVREAPDLCLLDVGMPGGGLHAAAEIRARVPSASVVMLTASTREDDVLGAVRAGAVGYLLKDDDPVRLPVALHDVLRGVPAFPRRLTRPILAAARSALAPPGSA